MESLYFKTLAGLSKGIKKLHDLKIPFHDFFFNPQKGKWELFITLPPGTMLSACADCGKVGELKDGRGVTGVSHGYCDPCLDKALERTRHYKEAKKAFVFLCLFLLALFATPSISSSSQWTKKDTAYELTYAVFHVVDWGQTLYVARNDGFSELNPILGPEPSVGEVNTYFLSTLIGHFAVSYFLPEEYRRYWQIGTIILQFGITARNAALGVKVSF